MTNFTPERSDIIRANLINHISEDLPPRRRRSIWAAGFVLAGALAGAGVSAGAFAATGMLTVSPAQPSGQPTPTYPDAVTAPPGVTPGAPIISLLGEPIARTIEASTQIPMEPRPAEATHARVTITALTTGTLKWGTDPGGNNPSGSWNAEDLAAGPNSGTWYDFPLDDSVDTLYLSPSAFTGIVTVQYVTHVPTNLGVNASGQSYGISGSTQGEPDLVSVIGISPDGDTVEGYAFASELNATSPDHPGMPSSPEEALRWQEEAAEKYSNGWTIPVYESDGKTQIGIFTIGG